MKLTMTTLSDLYKNIVDAADHFDKHFGIRIFSSVPLDDWLANNRADTYQQAVNSALARDKLKLNGCDPRFRVYNAILTYLIARDQGIDAAMLWKLSNDA